MICIFLVFGFLCYHSVCQHYQLVSPFGGNSKHSPSFGFVALACNRASKMESSNLGSCKDSFTLRELHSYRETISVRYFRFLCLSFIWNAIFREATKKLCFSPFPIIFHVLFVSILYCVFVFLLFFLLGI